MNFTEAKIKIIEFATRAHEGQFRKDGKPYITHPLAVMQIAEKEYRHINSSIELESEKKFMVALLFIWILAVSHDICEDVKKYKNNEILYIIDLNQYLGDVFKETFVNDLISGLKKLNKNYYQNYLEYILNIEKDAYASLVKRADLSHNMSDLPEGSLKDKYRLAEYILTN